MNKKYIKPSCEVLCIAKEDICSASGGTLEERVAAYNMDNQLDKAGIDIFG